MADLCVNVGVEIQTARQLMPATADLEKSNMLPQILRQGAFQHVHLNPLLQPIPNIDSRILVVRALSPSDLLPIDKF